MAEQFDLLSVAHAKRGWIPDRMLTMYRMYERTEGARCGSCAHYYTVSGRGNRPYHKCALNTDTGNARSDWGRRWPACGRWERAEDET